MARRLASKSRTSTAPVPESAPVAPPPASAGTATLTPPAAVAPAKPATPAIRRRPTQEDISRRAFEIWVASGRIEGRDIENWKQAERELGA